MTGFYALFTLAVLSILQAASTFAQDLEWEVGLSSSRHLIEAMGVNGAEESATTILYLAGLSGPDASSERARILLEQYDQLQQQARSVSLIVIPVANPESEILQFPPIGNAYSEQSVSHALWRWIGVHAPDLVLIGGPDSPDFEEAAENVPVAGIGTIPVQVLGAQSLTIDQLNALREIEKSPARLEIDRRLDRSPEELARQLAEDYGQVFSTPAYVPGMGLIGRMRLGFVEEVETVLGEYLNGPDIEITNASLMAGQLVFAEHAELTGNPRSVEIVVRAASLAFDDQEVIKDVMPFHNEMSDSVFMAPPLLTKAGKLTGNAKYYDMVERHVSYMQDLLLRESGLYNHSPLADVAWSRGNAFPALGLALVLTDFPEEHPGYSRLLESYVTHLETLIKFQNNDGLWRQVIDYPGSYSELSSTAMIGIAIKRGLDRGWLNTVTYQPVLNSIWEAVSRRTSANNEFINVCTSTGKLQSLDAYLDRLAILGRDDRAGGMVMNLAIELSEGL